MVEALHSYTKRDWWNLWGTFWDDHDG